MGKTREVLKFVFLKLNVYYFMKYAVINVCC
jgi:hypothetical protein